MPSICKLELVWPSYSLCKITKFFMKCVFALTIILSILVCTIMLGFCKSGHIWTCLLQNVGPSKFITICFLIVHR